MKHRRRACVVGLVGAVLLALALPGAAGAHAVLLTTEPGNDVVLDDAVDEVRLRFNESVETAFSSLRVYDSAARRHDGGDVSRPDSRTVAIGIEGRLPHGTYTVTWRAISGDSHPVSGAFVFHVGAPGASPAGIAGLLEEGTPRSVTVGLTFIRFLDFALLLLVAGGAGALVWVLAGAAERVRRRLGLLVAGAAAALALTALAGIAFQGAAAGGFGVGEALRPSVFEAVLDTRFGKVWFVQAVLAGILACVTLAVRRFRTPAGALLVAALAAALVATPALAGHASTAGAVSILSDILHVAAAAAWTGGLAALVLGLIWAGTQRWPLAAQAVPRFSAVALGSVAVLLAAGTVNGYLQVGELRGLWETVYGRLLVLKVAIVLPILAFGAYNNRFAVPRLRRQIASVVEQRRFLRMAGAELALMVAVVAVTAVLVAEPPAKATVDPRGPFATETALGPLTANIVVDPAEAGANVIHLYLLDRSGRPVDVTGTKLAATLPSKEIGPLRFVPKRLAPGHYSVYGADLALAGDWQLAIEARRGEFEALTNTTPVRIRRD